MNARSKLWTGRTPRQALVQSMEIAASVKGLKVTEALEYVLDGADACPNGSESRESLRYWNGLSGDAQQRLLSKVRRELRELDRILGRKVER